MKRDATAPGTVRQFKDIIKAYTAILMKHKKDYGLNIVPVVFDEFVGINGITEIVITIRIAESFAEKFVPDYRVNKYMCRKGGYKHGLLTQHAMGNPES